MTFTRTASGLKNYNKFFNSNIIVYIEGRQLEKNDLKKLNDNTSFDIIFYNSLFNLLYPSNKVKIKTVGCKSSVLDYNNMIIENKIDNSYTVIDRDYDQIFSSSELNDKLIITHGYSWENDFWSIALCEKIIKNICLDHNNGSQIINNKFKRSIYRLCLINRANIICKHFGDEIFAISRKGGTHGFNYDARSEFPLSKNERKRIFDKIPENVKKGCSKEIINSTKIHHRYLIQGHFYEHMWLQILSYASKKSSNSDNKINDFNTLKIIAFNLFRDNTNNCLSPETIKHYKMQFERVFKITISL